VTVIQSSIFHVLEKFPNHSGEVKRLFKESQEFQTMCDDYRQCAWALHYWRRSEGEEAPARRQEYEGLLQQLVEEIRYCLNASCKSGG
jgi:hypothetical protein